MQSVWPILVGGLWVVFAAQLVLTLMLFRYCAILLRRTSPGRQIATKPEPQIDRASQRGRPSFRRTSISGEGDCATCSGLCCRYISVPLDTPEEPDEFDWIRWVVSHEGVIVYVEDDAWYAEIPTPCSHLTDDHRCSIYDTRPSICREYSTKGCEQTSDDLEDYGWDHYWLSVESFEEYLRETMGGEWEVYTAEQNGLNRQHQMPWRTDHTPSGTVTLTRNGETDE